MPLFLAIRRSASRGFRYARMISRISAFTSSVSGGQVAPISRPGAGSTVLASLVSASALHVPIRYRMRPIEACVGIVSVTTRLGPGSLGSVLFILLIRVIEISATGHSVGVVRSQNALAGGEGPPVQVDSLIGPSLVEARDGKMMAADPGVRVVRPKQRFTLACYRCSQFNRASHIEPSIEFPN